MLRSYWNALVVVCLLAQTGLADNGPTVNGVEWVNHYGQARQLSHQTNRPVLLFLSTDGCIHCTRMQAGLRDHRVASTIQNGFVPAALKLDAESSLAKDLRVTLYPTTVIIAPNGKILDYVRGYTPPEQLSPRLARALRANPTPVASVPVNSERE